MSLIVPQSRNFIQWIILCKASEFTAREFKVNLLHDHIHFYSLIVLTWISLNNEHHDFPQLTTAQYKYINPQNINFLLKHSINSVVAQCRSIKALDAYRCRFYEACRNRSITTSFPTTSILSNPGIEIKSWGYLSRRSLFLPFPSSDLRSRESVPSVRERAPLQCSLWERDRAGIQTQLLIDAMA